MISTINDVLFKVSLTQELYRMAYNARCLCCDYRG